MIGGVLFDLDGTLLDSAPDLVGALNALRRKAGLDSLPVAKMESAASAGAVSLLKAGMPGADDQTFEHWRKEFLEHYQKNIFVESDLFDGARALIEFLRKESIPWGIVTNKPGYLTHPILHAAQLKDSVSAVVCGDTLSERKPHPAPVLLACEQLKIEPGDVLFVGDDPRDLEAGRAAGVRNCAVMYGYGSGLFESAEHALLLRDAVVIEALGDLIQWIRIENRLIETLAK